jgi:hypothetical protein
MGSAFTIYSAYAHLTALLMMRCRTGTARSYAAPGSELVAVPEQRRTASRFPRPQIMEALVHALALRRVRDTGRVMRRHAGRVSNPPLQTTNIAQSVRHHQGEGGGADTSGIIPDLHPYVMGSGGRLGAIHFEAVRLDQSPCAG